MSIRSICKNTGISIAVLSHKIRFDILHGLNLILCKIISGGLNLFSEFFHVQYDIIRVKSHLA